MQEKSQKGHKNARFVAETQRGDSNDRGSDKIRKRQNQETSKLTKRKAGKNQRYEYGSEIENPFFMTIFVCYGIDKGNNRKY